jgi:hypothetical protein
VKVEVKEKKYISFLKEIRYFLQRISLKKFLFILLILIIKMMGMLYISKFKGRKPFEK